MMEPVQLGKKRALLVKQNSPRYNEIIKKLREYSSVQSWEKNKNTWTHEALEKIKDIPFLVHPRIERVTKSGNRVYNTEYFLLLTTINNKKLCCLIEKKKPLEQAKVYQTRFRFHEDVYNGTLFIGTLTSTDEDMQIEREEITSYFSQIFPSIDKSVSAGGKNKNWLFVIQDMWGHCQEISSLLFHRLLCIQDILGKKWYSDNRIDICDFDIIHYHNYSSIESFLEKDRKYFSYPMNDSNVVFVCSQSLPGIEEYYISLKNIPEPLLKEICIFKNGEWSVEKNEIPKNTTTNTKQMLYITSTDIPDVYYVYNIKNKNKIGVARVKSIGDSKKLRDFCKKEFKKIQCVWNSEFEKWEPNL